MDKRKITWTSSLISRLERGKEIVYSANNIRIVQYRPYCKMLCYADPSITHRSGQWSTFFPSNAEMTYQQVSSRCFENIVVINSERGPFISNILPDLELVHHGQCFPLYWYEEAEIGSADGVGDGSTGTDPDGGSQGSLFDSAADSKTATGSTDAYKNGYIRHDAITDETLAVFRAAYPQVFQGRRQKDGGSELTKEDIFYYVYGILHSPEYRKRFAANLAKELPRILLAQDFAAFSQAGRALAELHLGYEEVEPWAGIDEDGNSANPGRTEKMRFGKCKKPRKTRKASTAPCCTSPNA